MKKLTQWIRCLCLSLATVASLTVLTPAFAQPAEENSQQAATVLVDLNNATESELTTLPGVGPSRARAIIAFRARRPFRRVEEVMRVRGIGRATFRQIRPMLQVGEPAGMR